MKLVRLSFKLSLRMKLVSVATLLMVLSLRAVSSQCPSLPSMANLDEKRVSDNATISLNSFSNPLNFIVQQVFRHLVLH